MHVADGSFPPNNPVAARPRTITLEGWRHVRAELLTGIPEIDAQHRRLFFLLDYVGRSIRNGIGRERMGTTLAAVRL